MVDAPVSRVVKPKLDAPNKGNLSLYDSDSDYDRACVAEVNRVSAERAAIKIEAGVNATSPSRDGTGPFVPVVVATPSPVRAPPLPAPAPVRQAHVPQQVAAPVMPAPAPQQVAPPSPVAQDGAMVVWAPQPQRVGAPDDDLMRAIIASAARSPPMSDKQRRMLQRLNVEAHLVDAIPNMAYASQAIEGAMAAAASRGQQ